MVIGPSGLGLFSHPDEILQVAELGVVLFLFLVGLEMRPSRLWGMRRQIFGLGLVQVMCCGLLLTLVGLISGASAAQTFVAGAGFVLTSTAIVMQLLEERGELASESGQQIVSVLLLEDLLIVPLLAVLAFLAPVDHGNTSPPAGIGAMQVATGLAALLGLIFVGRHLLNPMFGLLAKAQAREVMTAAALLVVLGASYLMELGGLSMAMGAFVAGVLLSESSYRHQLEVDIEPFRGILLGLFFIAVGMSLDFAIVADNWRTILTCVALYMLMKAMAIYAVARIFHVSHDVALKRAVIMAQGGEFAFVLYAAAASAGIIDAEQNAMLTAIVIVSMGLTPMAIAVLNLASRQRRPSTEGYQRPADLHGAALIIGFGRVGQIASQYLLARTYSISIIDTDVEMIDVARGLDYDVYYGDGTRLDILQAAGASLARVVLVCVDKAEDGTKIVELLKEQFPRVPVLARATDRVHSLALIKAGADVQVRETFESSAALGAAALSLLGVDANEVSEIDRIVRERDKKRLQMEVLGGIGAGNAWFSGRRPPADGSPSPPEGPDR